MVAAAATAATVVVAAARDNVFACYVLRQKHVNHNQKGNVVPMSRKIQGGERERGREAGRDGWREEGGEGGFTKMARHP